MTDLPCEISHKILSYPHLSTNGEQYTLDMIAYKNIFSEYIDFGLKNIAMIAAWGKDPMPTLIQLCKRYDISYFIIHDWDLDDRDIDVRKMPNEANKTYQQLDSVSKAQFTKNYKIYKASNVKRIHWNKRNLETVLGLTDSEKQPAKIFEKTKGKKLDQIRSEFPELLSSDLLEFLGLEKET
jgi:hypothetical protein